jgi:hypothetical protein
VGWEEGGGEGWVGRVGRGGWGGLGGEGWAGRVGRGREGFGRPENGWPRIVLSSSFVIG